MTGIREQAIARATPSSLKGARSSSERRPGEDDDVDAGSNLEIAEGPDDLRRRLRSLDTDRGDQDVDDGKRRRVTVRMSRTTAPVGDVTTPIPAGR